ncbi:hypothetical protein BH23BAC1_BH23BAC1_25160 [soil metagenome]
MFRMQKQVIKSWIHFSKLGERNIIGQSWRNNWDNLATFSEFPQEIRRTIYTTNIIENINRNIRKYTKNKTMLSNDTAVEKVVYLALMQAKKNGPCLKETGLLC